MTTAYSSVPINFINIVSNRPAFEVSENSLLLVTFFYDYGFNLSLEYLEENDVECDEDLIYKGMITGLNSFFNQDNELEFQNYVDEFRQRKFNSDQNVEPNKFTIDFDTNEEEYNVNSNNSKSIFSQTYNDYENTFKNFVPETHAEKIIYEVLKTNSPKEYIKNVYLNRDLFEEII